MKQISKDNNSLSIYIIFSIALFVLLCLAIWQLNKHYQKTERKNLIDLKLKQEPKYISNLNLNLKKPEIIKIKAEILENKSLFFEPRTYKGKVGYHKLTPLKVEDKYVLVNRGFTTQKEIETTPINKINIMSGIIINFPKPKFFELKNNIKDNKWYSLVAEDISLYLNIKLEPFLIYEIDNNSNKVMNVKPNYLSEINHLNYAMTWFMLAITLIIIFIIFMRREKNV
ncbi:MAG: SURF1 family protein [Pseudomonadota bacterium]|nr:SURF1 family protein [Pseudomonadota bacterium]